MSKGKVLLADHLMKIGAVKFGEFQLREHQDSPTAPSSPIFFNIRTRGNPKPGPLTGLGLFYISKAMGELSFNKQTRYIAGIPNAGEPIAWDFSHHFLVPGPQEVHFSKRRVDGRRHIGQLKGRVARGEELLLIDDVITRADTKLEAIEAAVRAGLVVRHLLVVVDRQAGGVAELEKRGVETHAVFTLTELIDYYLGAQMITKEQHRKVLDYMDQTTDQ